MRFMMLMARTVAQNAIGGLLEIPMADELGGWTDFLQ